MYKPLKDYKIKDTLESGDPLKVIYGADIQGELDAISAGMNQLDNSSHGNVASCYFNPDATPQLVYSYNIVAVVPDSLSASQTRIVFDNNLPNFDDAGAAHFAFNLTPISATGYPIVVTVTQAQAQYISFLAWQVVGSEFQLVPAAQLAFSFMVNDMDASQ